MIYNLFINATTNVPLTNYYSAQDANDRGQRIYAVDWSFLPEDKKFKVSFRFNSLGGSFTSNNLLYITTSFGPNANSVSAGSSVARKPNNILGILKVRQGTTATTDLCLASFPDNNRPLFLNGRPNDNLLEIKIMSNPTTQYNLGVDYILILSFEEVTDNSK